jgi:hypothetical protein
MKPAEPRNMTTKVLTRKSKSMVTPWGRGNRSTHPPRLAVYETEVPTSCDGVRTRCVALAPEAHPALRHGRQATPPGRSGVPRTFASWDRHTNRRSDGRARCRASRGSAGAWHAVRDREPGDIAEGAFEFFEVHPCRTSVFEAASEQPMRRHVPARGRCTSTRCSRCAAPSLPENVSWGGVMGSQGQ